MSRKYDAGIYRLYNTKNGKSYVGGTVRLGNRRRQHFSDLKLNKHGNSRLQEDYNQYGKLCFEFQILERLSSHEDAVVIANEQKWMDLLKPEYNINQMAGKYIGDYVRTSQAKIKRHTTVSGRVMSEKQRNAISVGLKNSPNNNKGRKFPQEVRDKIKKATTGENNPNYGKPRSNETKERISKANLQTHPGIVSPSGEIFPVITNLPEFCKEHDLDYSSTAQLLKGGKMKSHKGWRKYIVE